MDRLLQFLLKIFIRRGTFRVTTSRGTVFTFGDGTGQPVSVRFATAVISIPLVQKIRQVNCVRPISRAIAPAVRG
jgi:hypothetical protein